MGMFNDYLRCNVNLGCKQLNQQCKEIAAALDGSFLEVFIDSKTRLKSQAMLKELAILNLEDFNLFEKILSKIKDPQEMNAIANIAFDLSLIPAIQMVFSHPLYISSHVKDGELRKNLIAQHHCEDWVIPKNAQTELQLYSLEFCHNLSYILNLNELELMPFLNLHFKKLKTNERLVSYIFDYMLSNSELWIQKAMTLYIDKPSIWKAIMINQIIQISLNKTEIVNAINKFKRKGIEEYHSILVIATEKTNLFKETNLLKEMLDKLSPRLLYTVLNTVQDLFQFHKDLLDIAFANQKNGDFLLSRFITISKSFPDRLLYSEKPDKQNWISNIVSIRHSHSEMITLLNLRAANVNNIIVKIFGGASKEDLLVWAVNEKELELQKDLVALFKEEFDEESLPIIEKLFREHNIPVPISVSQALNDVCCICLNDFAENPRQIGCGHLFHRDCIKKWLSIKSSCPMCAYKCAVKSKKVNTN